MGGNADTFTVLPFVNVAEFIDEIRKSDRITVDLYADFDGKKVPRAHLGKSYYLPHRLGCREN